VEFYTIAVSWFSSEGFVLWFSICVYTSISDP